MILKEMELTVFRGCLCVVIPLLAVGFNIDVKQASILSGDPDSYYGYSVAMMVEPNKKAWVFVGAPRGNDTGLPTVERPGAIHKCDFQILTSPQCEQVLHIDDKADYELIRFAGGSKSVYHGKNGQWLGGTLDVPSIESGKGIVTCGHRWYNRFNDDLYFMNGLCYEIPAELTMSNVLKYPIMVNGSSQTIKLPWNKTVDYYSMAALGMAVHRSKESKLLLGTPGLFDWTGGFVEITGDKVKMMESVVSMANDTISHLYGSAITSGEYFGDNQVYYVIGGPRANLSGKVVIFNAANAVFSLALTDAEIFNESLPMNANYGSVLCTADVNNDGLDDLLVGAPLYSPRATNVAMDTADQGRVYLYLGTKRNIGETVQFDTKAQIFSGRVVAGAQFGSAISGLGDINGDNYPDIAIGSPYEDDYKGAVYIYNGYRDGLYPRFSQRIEAAEIDHGLRGFGISLSKPADLNSDRISDLAVGAYLSDQAVVLYGQPVIKLPKKELLVMNSARQQIDLVARNSSDIFVFTCFQYIYSGCSYIEFDVTIKLDTGKGDYPRLESTYTKQTSIFLALKLFNANYMCNDQEIGRLAVRSTSDLVSPIVIEANYSIKDLRCQGMNVKPTINAFNGDVPGDPLLVMQTVLHFKKDCPDNQCETDLHLSYQTEYYNNKDYFISGTPYLGVVVNITKDGDPSYGSNFIITFPNFLRFRKFEQIHGESLVSCSPIMPELPGLPDNEKDASLKEEELSVKLLANESGQVCSFGNPMFNNSGVEFLIKMEVPSLVTISTMELHLAALTQSRELNPADNNQTVRVELRHEVAPRFSGRASPEVIFVGKSWSSNYPTKHVYELENSGPSLLPSGRVHVYFPQYQHGGRAHLFVEKIEANCSYPCELNCSLLNKGNVPPIHLYENGRQLNYIDANVTDTSTYDGISQMDCSSGECASYHCGIRNLPARRSVLFAIEFALTNEIQRLTKDGKEVTFTTKAEVHLDSKIIVSNDTDITEQLHTYLIPPKSVKGVDWWIIVASIIGGIALIALIIFILYKCGFFKRKRWEYVTKTEAPEEEKNAMEPDNDKASFTDSEDGILDKEEAPAKDEVTF